MKLMLTLLTVAITGALPALAETFTLRIGGGHAAAVPYIKLTEEFFVPEVERRVAERTEHRVRFIEAYGGSIAKLGEELEAVEKGILDIGQMCFCFEPSKAFALNLNYYVPFTTPSAVQQLRVTRAVYAEHPEIVGRFESAYGQTLLALTGYDNYNLATSFPWETVADLQGRKIGGAGPNLPWLDGTGAIVVQSSLSDFYNGIASGVFEGALLFPASYNGLRLYEVAEYYKIVDIGAVIVNGMTINKATEERLPPEILNIIREVAAEYELKVAETLDEAQVTGLSVARENGADVSELPEDQRVAWAERLRDWPNKMAIEMTSQGYEGSAIFRDYLAELAADGYALPVDYPIE